MFCLHYYSNKGQVTAKVKKEKNIAGCQAVTSNGSKTMCPEQRAHTLPVITSIGLVS